MSETGLQRLVARDPSTEPPVVHGNRLSDRSEDGHHSIDLHKVVKGRVYTDLIRAIEAITFIEDIFITNIRLVSS